MSSPSSEATHPVVPPRPRARTLTSVLEANAAKMLIVLFTSAISVPILLRYDVTAPTMMVALAMDTLTLVGIALSLWWLLPGAVLAGLGATVLLAVPGAVPLTAIFLPIILFRAGVRGHRRLRTVLAVWYVPLLAYWMLFLGGGPTLVDVPLTIGVVTVGILVTWFAGDHLNRQRSEIVRLDEARVEAVRAERMAIARDLHDAVASANARIVLRAEAAKLAGGASTEDIDYILSAARQSASDLRGMLAALRSTLGAAEVSATSPWHIASLREVVEHHAANLRSQGFTVSVLLPESLDLPQSTLDAVGKFVVEGTSNVGKYADPTKPCRIMIDQDEDGTEGVIISGRRAGDVADPDPATSSGFGLLGVSERVTTLGGTVDIHPTADQWVVRIEIPSRES